MPPLPTTALLVLLAFVGFAFEPLDASDSNQASICPVTEPANPPYVPPPPYKPEPGGEHFWFGTDRLWVALPANGVWSLGRYRRDEPRFRQKLFWYRDGYIPSEEPKPKLMVTGRRLDGLAPALDVDGPDGAWSPTEPAEYFIIVGLNFPTTGCWEISGEYGQNKLTFVIWVQDGTITGSAELGR